jgi:CRISPR-associated protein Csb2
LRHAGLRAGVTDIHVQREPFDRRGWRAEVFAVGTRFAKERLWHVDLEFESPTVGPLPIGDGRFLGLGVMQPAQSDARVLAFSILSGSRRYRVAAVGRRGAATRRDRPLSGCGRPR